MNNYILNGFDNAILCVFVNKHFNHLFPNEDPERFLLESYMLKHQIPARIQFFLDDFLQNGSKTGFKILENIDIQEIYPPTPDGNDYFIGEKTDFAKVIAIFNQYLGEMISYEAECFGRLFQDMVPKKSLSNSQTSLSSNVELEIHTEQAFSDLRPDILTLGCLRGDENAITYILPVNVLLEKMDTSKIKLLREPLWNIGVDLSFKMNNNEFIHGDMRGPMPIIYGSENDPLLVFDQDLMIGITEEAEQLKREIIEIYYKYRYSYVLKPGDVVFVDNKRAVHGRSSFTPKFDGTDRFIIRSFVTLDFDRSAHARNQSNKRMVEAKYS